MNKNHLEVRDLRVGFDLDGAFISAVEGVSFDVRVGEVLGLVGESGCGKSVTALSVMRLVPTPPGRLVSGEVRFDGRDLLKIPAAEMRAIRGRRISMIFQEPMTALSPLMPIGKQLMETLRLHGHASGAENREASEAWLAKVGIPDPRACMTRLPHQLSGGMRQRVMIAMALMLDPDVIIADEPTTALDVTVQAQIFELLMQAKSEKSSVLFITHDMGVVWEICDRMLVMRSGTIVEEGSVRDVFRAPRHEYTQSLLRAALLSDTR